MRISSGVVWAALADCLVFLASFGVRTGRGLTGSAAGVVGAVYWLTAFVGLALAVYGFLVLTRGGGQYLRKSTTCILFALTPGCVGLVALLSHLGTQPV